MRRNFLVNSTAVILSLALGGCVGTTFLKRGSPPQKEDTSPSLRTVPERPPKISLEERQHTLEDLEESYETDRQEILSDHPSS